MSGPAAFSLIDRIERALARRLLRLPGPVQRGLAGGRPVVVDGLVLLPEMQLMLAARRLTGAGRLGADSAERARRRMRRDCLLHGGAPVPVGAVRDLEIDGAAGSLRARHYAPASGGARPLLLFLHGGGFVMGDLETHDAPCRVLCREMDAHVLAIDYRLAPEHPFPAAVEDAVAAYRWARAHAGSLGAEPGRLAVAGDSAGGNLAAVVAQAAAGDPALALQLLIYPVLDLTQRHASRALFADGFLLTAEDTAWFDELYRGGTGSDAADVRISPMAATDLAGLAPALVVTAAFDPLRDEAEAYAARLAGAGVPVRLRRVDGLVHGFINFTGVSPAAHAGLVALAREARDLLAGAS